MAQILPLENVNGTRDDWVIQTVNRVGGGAGSGFTGSETLTVNVAIVQGGPLAFTATTTWASFASGTVNLTITAANSALLMAGQVYQGEILCTPSGQDPDCIALFTLTSLPSAGSGGLIMRSLVELDEAANLLSILPTASQDVLGQALRAATEALEALCRRTLVLTNYDRLYRPGRTRKIYLDTRPCAIVTGMSCWLDVAGTVSNTTVANQLAYISMTPVSITQNTPASWTFSTIASGVASTATLTAAANPTIGGLFAAINALGNGWQANALNGIYGLFPSTRLNYQMGQFGVAANQSAYAADGQSFEMQLYSTDLWRYIVDPDRGIVELTQNLPEAFRYADRAFGSSFGWGWSGATEPRNANVRVQYRAGYAIAAADLALGYQGVPSTLRTATLITARAIMEAAQLEGVVQSQSVSGRSYTLRSDASVVPRSARVLLAKELNFRFGGWGSR